MKSENNTKAWKEIWSAGHGVDVITKTSTASCIIEELEREYNEGFEKLNEQIEKLRFFTKKKV